MPITVTCPNCQKALKVPDTAIGKKVKCPACQTAFPVSNPDEAVSEAPARPTAAKKPTPPAFEDEDDAEERVTASARPRAARNDDEDDEEDEERPRKRKKKADDDDEDYGDIRAKTPHRGTTILVLGILSIVLNCCCFLLSFVLGGIAFTMANTDLAQMSKGKMDAAGRGSTNAGKICGIVGIVLGILNLIITVIYYVINPPRF